MNNESSPRSPKPKWSESVSDEPVKGRCGGRDAMYSGDGFRWPRQDSKDQVKGRRVPYGRSRFESEREAVLGLHAA